MYSQVKICSHTERLVFPKCVSTVKVQSGFFNNELFTHYIPLHTELVVLLILV
jgi:hypothetical protein